MSTGVQLTAPGRQLPLFLLEVGIVPVESRGSADDLDDLGASRSSELSGGILCLHVSIPSKLDLDELVRPECVIQRLDESGRQPMLPDMDRWAEMMRLRAKRGAVTSFHSRT